MKTNSKLIRIIALSAAFSVILFAVIQVLQHGYDAPLHPEHLVVDMQHSRTQLDPLNSQIISHKHSRNIESLSQQQEAEHRINTIEQQLEEHQTSLDLMHKRIQVLEQHTSSHNTSIAGNNDEYIAPTNVIYGNPLNDKQCQNALLELDDIDIEQLITENSKYIQCHKRQNWRPHIWTREGIGSLTKRLCYRPHTPIRTTTEYMDVIKINKSLTAKHNDEDVPVYYHMPKCASSSTAGMLQDHFNFKQQFLDGPETNHPAVHTNCGFTFIRNPIDRFISGYYTVNNMLFRECRDERDRKTFSNCTNEKYDASKFKFIRIIGEPERFEMYLEEMFGDPYSFGKTLPFRHTGTQMYFLSNWYGSDIQFFGRVEQYEEHFNELMEFENCKWFKENMKPGIDKLIVPNSMYHYGFYGPTLWNKANGEKKEYIDALGMRKNLEKMHSGRISKRVDPNDLLAPAYYFITEKTYNRIIEYFWQDFICFGYPTDYQNFKNYVATFVNPSE